MNGYSETRREWQCPKCGWDSLGGDPEADEFEITRCCPGPEGGQDFDIEYTCPICGTVFSYSDSTY